MVSKLALLLTIGLAVARPAPQENKPFIVGGVEASAGEFPYIVSLQVSNSHICGGSLISPTVVVTAAHCSGRQPSQVRVRAGTTRWSSGGTVASVSSITVHPGYNDSVLDNDIALWKLAQPLGEGNNIGYVKLPTQGSDPSANSTTTVAGWGYLQEGGWSVSPVLMKVDVPIVGRGVCTEQYADFNPITEQMVCAGLQEGGKDACQGDSGGPLVDSTGTLVGLVSWGSGCARANYPGVYTRVGSFIEWIAQNI
ncbi:hypothetical protein NLU13_4592 [Sarocladium strictum]|uniref:Peptidase S1 domain-containing protein n=1 Tax=Sarocladium strictum TaxID=5046 RepID=A0AA39GLR9_SARSR|nr:hypothetical protein NLU13_4592 [Sarocladium strictum]